MPRARLSGRLRYLDFGAIADAELETVTSIAQADLFGKGLELEDAAVDLSGVSHDPTPSLFAPGFGRDLYVNLAAVVLRFEGDTEVSAVGSHEILLQHVLTYRMNDRICVRISRASRERLTILGRVDRSVTTQSALAHIGRELPLVARRALEALVRGEPGSVVPVGPPAPVFVTLRSRDGSLRGCVGSTRPVTSSVAEETARSATLAATRDPRFPEVSAAELGSLAIEVSVLLPAEPVLGLADLAPDRYGVIVREEAGSRQALLLPGIDGILDAATQVAIARQKAGLAEHVPVVLSRFEVLKFKEAAAGAGLGERGEPL